MKKVKYKFFLDYEKEEKWINAMAKNGWHLEKFSFGRYQFTKGEPGTFVYRNEYLGGLSIKERKDYIELLKDSGVIIVNEFGSWIYMKKLTAEGPFELYTDKKSKINYYNRILYIFFFLFILNIGYGISNITFFSNESISGFLRACLGVINSLLAILIAIPIVKIFQRKRKLQADKFFE